MQQTQTVTFHLIAKKHIIDTIRFPPLFQNFYMFFNIMSLGYQHTINTTNFPFRTHIFRKITNLVISNVKFLFTKSIRCVNKFFTPLMNQLKNQRISTVT